ncbi:MAG: RIP metalloprotease RseP [Balneolaceae bacterium]|nr:RIP metalloprotease RseP [Balneolaceae bacterium]
MAWIISILSTIGIFAAALLIMVFFHELGHFLAAKLFGMRVERFSVGFPPRVWGIKKGETDYCIGATPLGGYVKISGMIDESMDTDHLDEEPKPWEYRSKPVWQRIIVITAGVIFNMLLAVMIFMGIAFTQGDVKVPVESVGQVYIQENSVADVAGFKTGDQIIGVNGERVQYFSDLVKPVQLTSDELSYMVMRNGDITTVMVADSLLNRISKEPFIYPQMAFPARIGHVFSGTPADSAGLAEGDEILSINEQEVTYWLQLVELIQGSGEEINLTVRRNGAVKRFKVQPNEENKIGIGPPAAQSVFEIQRISYGLTGSLAFGVDKTVDVTQGIIQGFSKMFSGSISVRENLGGPVAIADITRRATEEGGALGFWNITAFLSITLAIMNILPIPVLDGGHLMFLIYEGITRREPSPKVRMALQQLGFILIIALFIFVTFNDIIRQFG